MQVIVDYNNVSRSVRRHGLKYLAESIANCLGVNVLSMHNRLNIRLYDGWYQEQSPTPLAQTTAAELQRDFPTTVTLVSEGKANVKAIVAAEMAYSLECDPHNHIWHTFRPRSGQSNILCSPPASKGCSLSSCSLTNLPAFFNKRVCPEAACSITTEDLIIRNEQKLVDSMMSTDLLSYHLNSTDELAIVSSDDDLWPAMRLLLHRGHKLYHIHTKRKRKTPNFYKQRVTTSQK